MSLTPTLPVYPRPRSVLEYNYYRGEQGARQGANDKHNLGALRTAALLQYTELQEQFLL